MSGSIDYDKICDEWLEYIASLDYADRKEKFLEYLDNSGVYDIDESTVFYKSELNNFLTEGITTLLHDKAQEAKKSGKGLAHYRHTSFALSKPDAMNIVHQYIHKKILLHSSMTENDTKEVPNTFDWNFLFNIVEYVYNKPLLSNDQIPQLPAAKKQPMPDEEEQNELGQQPNDDIEPSPSIDPQQVIENVKDKILSSNNDEEDKEYSPDPYDVDENAEEVQKPVEDTSNLKINSDEPIKFGGVKVTYFVFIYAISQCTSFCHCHCIQYMLPQMGTPKTASNGISGGHNSMGTTQFRSSVIEENVLNENAPQQTKAFDKDRQKLARQNSSYLESWTAKKTNDSGNKMIGGGHTNKLSVGRIDGLDGMFASDTGTPGHAKTNSAAIQGGFWRSQEEKTEKIEVILHEAEEHRDKIIDMLRINQQEQSMFVNTLSKIGNNVNMIGSDMEKQQNETMLNLDKIMNKLNDIQSNFKNDEIEKLNNEKNELTQKYEAKIRSLEQELSSLRKDFLSKDALINEQSLKIKELEIVQMQSKKLENVKNEILESMQNEFDAFKSANKSKKKSAFDDEKINDLMDKQDDILSKFNSLQKHYKDNKDRFNQIEESMENMNENGQKYFNQTTKKMGDYFSKLNASINNIEVTVEQKSNNSNNAGMSSQSVTSFTKQLADDMSAANMLSIMREEYNNIRREKDEMRKEVERYRKENEELSLQANRLKEEAINTREAKRRTVKNLVDEINTMRDQIYKLSKGKIKNGGLVLDDKGNNDFVSSLSRHINM